MKNKISFAKSVRVLCISAMLIAISVIIGWICKLYMTFDFLGGSVRITFENLPIILSGMAFGPFTGLAVGAASDIVSTAFSQYGLGGINPIITAGSAAVGLVAGLCRYIPGKNGKKSILIPVAAAHTAGSVIIKSIGLYVYHFYVEVTLFGIGFNSLFLRIPTYIIIGAIEYYIISVLRKNRFIAENLDLGYTGKKGMADKNDIR